MLHATMIRATMIRATMSPATIVCAALLAVSATAQIDHRPAQSPVKNQGGRGTCVAFSICAALETFPGVPTDLSEQLLYATVKLHENDVDKWLRQAGQDPAMRTGNAFETYVPMFSLIGTCHESFLPYDPNARKAGPNVPEEIRRYLELAQIGERDLHRLRDGFGKYGFRPNACQVLMVDAAQDVARIKRELDQGRLAIPVSYAVYGPKWSTADDAKRNGKKGARTIIHPGLMHAYRRPGEQDWSSYGASKLGCTLRKTDFVTEVREGKLETGSYPDPKKTFYGGHAVTIVGYDNRGFLAKNSWGTTWGDDGYCTILFDYHALFATRALLIDDVYIRTPILSPFKTRPAILKGRFRLKVQTRGTGKDARWILSTWMREPRDANLEAVHYAVEVRNHDGAWQPLSQRLVRPAGLEHRHGAAMVLRGSELARALTAKSVRVTVRYGGTQIPDPNNPEHATFHRTIRFAEFAPQLRHAIDVMPSR